MKWFLWYEIKISTNHDMWYDIIHRFLFSMWFFDMWFLLFCQRWYVIWYQILFFLVLIWNDFWYDIWYHFAAPCPVQQENNNIFTLITLNWDYELIRKGNLYILTYQDNENFYPEIFFELHKLCHGDHFHKRKKLNLFELKT